jgi:uncharacterized Tic20 family protein
MSQPTDDAHSPTTPPEGRPAGEERPPPHGSLYGQPEGSPSPGYGQAPHAPAYGQPGPGGQGPYAGQWGYGPPGNPGAPRTHAVGDDTTWALFSYIGMIIAGFVAPLVIYFVKRNQSAFIRHHAAQALNYTITVILHMLIAVAIVLPIVALTSEPVWFVLLIPVFLFHTIGQYVFIILGTIRSSRGEMYTFPSWTCWRMIR